MKIVCVVFICLALGACSSKKQVAERETRERVHKVSYVDTLLYTPATKTELSLSLATLCDSLVKNRNWKSQSGNARASIKIENDTVYLTATCDSVALAAKIRKELILDRSETEKAEKSHSGISLARYIITSVLCFLAGAAAGIILRKFII